MRRLVAMVAVALLAVGCRSVPTVIPNNAPAIAETQAAVASGAATVASGADRAAGEARAIVEAARKTGDAVLIAQAERHAKTTGKLDDDARKLMADVDTARKEVVSLLGAKAIAEGAYQNERVEKERAMGQRNTLAAILAGIGAVVLAGIALKIVYRRK